MSKKSNYILLRSSHEDDLLFAGVKDYSSRLKQQALLFDQIGILHLENLIKTLESFQKHENFEIFSKLNTFFLEVKWLQENEIIFEPQIDTEFENGIHKILQAENSTTSELRWLNSQIKADLNEEHYEDFFEKLKSRQNADSFLLRMMALTIEANRNISALTTLSDTGYNIQLSKSKISDVAQIAIKKLPLPTNTTPWEAILDYRNDRESQESLLAFRRWIKKLSSQELSINEIEEELEWLINEFQNHMRVHKMKADVETLEIIVKAPLEIIENLIKLKLSKIPDPLFALSKRKINLLEAEINAPGRELAYIIKSNEFFNSE
ncbi:MAG: hypothetical protein U0X74_04900 [Anaerolineales bacterium]